MKPVVAIVASLALMSGAALAQQAGQPPADPLSVKPVPPQEQRSDSDTIRSKIEQAGYTEIADLGRDTTGVWRARARKGNEAVDVIVDKGGRIRPAPR